jgi:hypothetical protein
LKEDAGGEEEILPEKEVEDHAQYATPGGGV